MSDYSKMVWAEIENGPAVKKNPKFNKEFKESYSRKLACRAQNKVIMKK